MIGGVKRLSFVKQNADEGQIALQMPIIKYQMNCTISLQNFFCFS